MSKTAVTTKEKKGLGISPNVLKRAVKGFEDRRICEEAYETHSLYHIEDWQKVVFIPGGTKLLRVHYIYDQTEDKAFMRPWKDKVELITEKKQIKKIDQVVKHPIKAMRNGVFVRKLRFSAFSRLFDLLLIMNGREELVLGQPTKGIISKKQYEKNKRDYIATIFDSVIEEK